MSRLLRTLLILGLLLLLLALIPGDFSFLALLKSLADRAVADGDFEALTVDFYNRLRLIMGIVALLLILISVSARYTRTHPRLVWLSLVGVLLLVGLAVFAALNLATRRLNSQVYRFLSGTPLAYSTTAPTPAPTKTTGPPPTPTEVIHEPGQWTLIASQLNQPVVLGAPDDDTGRLFIGSKVGIIYIVQNGQTLPTPFLNLHDQVLQELESPEQGFLGLVFHPDYAQNGYFYVNYTDAQGDIRVVRYQVSATDPNQADPNSAHIILRILEPEAIHNGGNLVFGPDGYLYISVGDGGIRLDPGEYAQSLDLLLGKILRIDVDHGDPYTIPADNPFAQRGGSGEIWLYGLRNPWRFSFDALTGDLFLGDVGHDDWEEIDYVPAGSPGGLNFGWNHYEGSRPYSQYSNPPPASLPDHVPPIWEYRNHEGGRCAIVGGYVYRGTALPALQGIYIYGDYCSGMVWGLHQNASGAWVNETLFDTPFIISSFGVDPAQNLYVLDLAGNVYQLTPK